MNTQKQVLDCPASLFEQPVLISAQLISCLHYRENSVSWPDAENKPYPTSVMFWSVRLSRIPAETLPMNHLRTGVILRLPRITEP